MHSTYLPASLPQLVIGIQMKNWLTSVVVMERMTSAFSFGVVYVAILNYSPD